MNFSMIVIAKEAAGQDSNNAALTRVTFRLLPGAAFGADAAGGVVQLVILNTLAHLVDIGDTVNATIAKA